MGCKRTDEFRNMLEEFGIKYEAPEDDTTIFYDDEGYRYTYNVNPESDWSQLFGYNLAPGLAIAVALGFGTCRLIRHDVELPDGLKDSDVEICVYECSECGERMFSDYNYCPNCGRTVRIAEGGWSDD